MTNSSQDFPKSKRLLKTKEFRLVFDEGSKKVSDSLVLLARKRNEAKENISSPHDRIGIIVSKKVGNAVTRNKIKRIIREHFRKMSHHQENGDLLGDVKIDFVAIARKSAALNKGSEIGVSLETSMKKLRKKLRQISENHRVETKKSASKVIPVKPGAQGANKAQKAPKKS